MRLLIRSILAIVLALSAALPGAAHDGHGAALDPGAAIAADHVHACDAEAGSRCDATMDAPSDCTLLIGHCASALAPCVSHDVAELTIFKMDVRPGHPQRVTGLMHAAEPPPPRI